MLDLNAVIEPPMVPSYRELDPTCPNVKELFRPDPGFVLFDADLEQADAQIVAWESNDGILKEIFRDPNLDLHTENAKMIFGTCPSKGHPNRKKAKAGVHAVNYYVKARTLAKTLGITVAEADAFIKRWFDIHPNIKEWHHRIEREMHERRYIQNAFGNRKVFHGDITHPNALSEALAWIPQSTVGLVINRAWDRLATCPDGEIQILLQVHDSLVGQVRKELLRQYMPIIHDAMLRPIPYEDPLVIGSSIELSLRSWGTIKEVSWDGFYLDVDGNKTDQKFELLL